MKTTTTTTCTVHQFITEIKMFSDNVCTVPTVVTVSSESAREKEGEHKRQEQSWTRRRHRVCFPPFSHYQACTFHVVFFMLSTLLFCVQQRVMECSKIILYYGCCVQLLADLIFILVYFQLLIPSKRFDIFPPDWGVLRRSRCNQTFL